VAFQVSSVRRSALAAALSLALVPAFAAEGQTDLEGVVVTATRTAQTQDQTLAAVTVIDRAEIERLQPTSVADLLRGTPGMMLANNGGPGKATSIFLRGTESDHVLVLVDGLKLGSATSGTASIQDIPVEQIERIEIVRGPFSSLYGSEAIGGVIQIFTRRPQGPFAPNLMLGFGSYRHAAGSAGFSGKSGDGWYALQASHDNTRGINACRVGAAEAFAACYADQPDRDGYRDNSLSLRGGYRFGRDWDGDAQFFRSEGHSEYDGSTGDATDTVSQVAGGKLHWHAAENVELSAGVGQTADLSKIYLRNAFMDRFDTRRTLGTVQADVGAGGGLYSVGFDWQRDGITSHEPYDADSRVDRGLFAQWQQAFGAQSLQASVRRDDNSQFGGRNTGSLLWGWDLARGLRLTASYGTAFRAPTFNELYYPDYGYADLRPERARNAELGLRGTHGWGWWSVSAFRNDISDLITYDPSLIDALHPYGAPNNIDRARIRGAEGALGTTLAGWTLGATATWLDPRDRAREGAYGNLLPRRARQSARLDADRSFGAFGVGASWFVSGYRYDDIANAHRLGGYALTDLRLAYALDRDWKLQLALDNVFGKRYETAWYYDQPGRNFMLTLRYQPAR
jgi:vitamin B12 transporter